MRRACIDIGSNTTRLLVVETDRGGLLEVHQERAFTLIRRGLLGDGSISPEKLAEVIGVVERQAHTARELGARDTVAVATAAVRQAPNGAALAAAIATRCGLPVRILSEREEAWLAFKGAAHGLAHVPRGDLGVADVGGGSSELVVGTAPDRVSWFTSLALGSGGLADGCLRSDPPSAAQLSLARAQIQRAVAGIEVPRPVEAVAVGGSAASLRRIAGPLLDGERLTRAMNLLCGARAAEVARRFALDVDRVRLLPAGLLILQAASELFGVPLAIGVGGLREGVLLEGVYG